MMKDLKVKIWKNTRMVDLPVSFIGNDMENLQKKFVFIFQDEFVNGQARLEYEINGEKAFIPLTKENETYTIPIKNVLTKEGNINMQLVIDEPEIEEETPTFKSNIFFLYCGKSLNAVGEAPDGYKIWIQQANDKLNEMDGALNKVNNLDIDVSKSGNTAIVTITKKDGTEESVEIKDGENGIDGADGNDALINGYNTINIEAGENIIIEQEDNILTISSEGGSGGTSDYEELENLPKINNVELKGNKISSDLGLQPAGNYALESEIPDVSNFITKDANNLTYYTLATVTGSTIELSINSSTYVMTLNLKNSSGTIISTGTIDLPLESVVVSGAYDDTTKKIILTLQSGSTVEFSVADLVSGLQSEITSSNKLSADLVDDTNTTNKFTNTTEKSSWNAKYDKPSEGIPSTDLSSAVQTSLGKADTALQSETYTGTITSVKMNGSTIASSGEADLGTVLTQHQSIKTINSTSLVGTGDVTVQETLISGTNIKTINNTSLLGSGDITISGGTATDVQINGTSITSNNEANIITKTAYNSSTNKIATESDLPDISGKLDTSAVKTTTNTTQGNVYDVTYINTMLGNIETLLGGI